MQYAIFNMQYAMFCCYNVITEYVICNLSVSFGKYLEKRHPVKVTRAGKSSKMSERGLLLDVKCPQSCVEEIPQNRQVYLI